MLVDNVQCGYYGQSWNTTFGHVDHDLDVEDF